MNPGTISLLVFIAAYLLFVALPARRMHVAAAAAALLVLTGVLTPGEAFRAVNWNVMGIFVGTLAVADVFMVSRVPAYLAEVIVCRSRSTAWAMLWICAMTGLISAFVENVATVLIVAPIALAMSRRLRITPVPMIIAIAVTSNLQGTATLIGDPPSMLLSGFARMTFADFFFYRGRPSIFFAVELGAAASFIVLYALFRRYRRKVTIEAVERPRSWTPTALLVALIAALALSSFFDTGFTSAAGLLCIAFGGISLTWKRLALGGSLFEGIRSLDWETAIFLAGIFVVVGSLTLTGWIDSISDALAGLVGRNVFLGYTLIVFVSVFLSAFVDNVPYLAAMLPVALSMADKLRMDPTLFLFGLLIGASLGGNVTPIGASANIVACGLLKKEGYEVRFGEFMRIGVPFTLVAVAAGYLVVWAVWGA